MKSSRRRFIQTALSAPLVGTLGGSGVRTLWALPQEQFQNPEVIRYDAKCFTIQGKDTFIFGAAFHYPRCPKALWRDRLRRLARHLLTKDVLFFAGGFVFDVVATREGVDHALLILQQVVYLSVIGGILYVDFVREAHPAALPMPGWLAWLWRHRSSAFHFCLGTLMNLYSIFFLMSASLVSSIAFVVLLFGAVVLNELDVVRRRGLDVKVAFYVLCIFCFWSLLIPILLHSISRLTFLL